MKTKRRIITNIFPLLCIAASSFCFVACNNVEFTPKEAQKVGAGDVARSIQKCSRLSTAEFSVKKIIIHKDDAKVKGSLFGGKFSMKMPASERKIAIPVAATLKAYIDFGDFSEENVSEADGKVEVVLADPVVEITSTRIMHDEIKRSVSLFRTNFSDEELTKYTQQGREAIIKSIPELGIIEMAKDNARQTITPLLKKMGFAEENIVISFSGDKSAAQPKVVSAEA